MGSGSSSIDRELTPTEGAMYMEMCAALMAMMGETEVTIHREFLPMKPFSIWRRAAADGTGVVIRVVHDK